MRTDFTPNNIEIWIDNWKRKNVIGFAAKSWLDSFPFEKINVIVNHSSVTIEDFPDEIKDRIKLWPNVLRHDSSKGPINKNINQAYVQTFLSKKKYCIFLHDSYYVKPGWEKCVIESDYDFYSAPQGDGFFICTLQGLKTFGWWDERYSSIAHWHEIDFLCRALRKSLVLNEGKCSLVDIHGLWPNDFPFVRNHHLYYNTVGLENFITRFPKNEIVQIGENANGRFKEKAEQWHKRKWEKMFDQLPHGSGTLYNILNGPKEPEIDWNPWLDLDNLVIDKTDY